ncbi:MAG: hypothetical protein HQK88_11585 [Nitrospirae bacterium]|nr:hypothetical protein [Nitrospirota bacterium]MBF0535530.1 hypothetical protein [Nitrospirota bacterium]MBF0617443.1 hypothetical protein [Nitrospirota bacterium]
MELPAELIIEYLSDFCICHFKDCKHDPEAPAHYYVNVPITDTSSLLLCIITSQVNSRQNYYYRLNPKAADSLVSIKKQDLPFTLKDCVVDCNSAELIKKAELLNRINPDIGFDIKEREIPSFLRNAIKQSVINSPLISKYIKKMLEQI